MTTAGARVLTLMHDDHEEAATACQKQARSGDIVQSIRTRPCRDLTVIVYVRLLRAAVNACSFVLASSQLLFEECRRGKERALSFAL